MTVAMIATYDNRRARLAPDPRRIVIIEFPSLDHARAFHASDDYAPVKALRDGAGEGQFIAVDGFALDEWAEVLAASEALGPTP